MRINYDLNLKTFFNYWNLGKGLQFARKKVKRHSNKRIKKWTTYFFSRILMWILLIPIFYFFETFIHLEWLVNLLVLFFILIPIEALIRLCCTIYTFMKDRNLWRNGEINLTEKGITVINNTGKTLEKTWYEIDFFFRGEKVLLLFTKKNIFFIIPLNYGEQKEVFSNLMTIQEMYPHIKTIDPIAIPELGFLKKQFLNWGIYIFLFIILIEIAVEWEEKNILILNKEIEKINDLASPIDSSIYAYEKFGIVEEELKNFFIPLKKSFLIYNENNATNTTFFLTSEYLKENREHLKDLLKEFENRKQITENAIVEIVELLELANNKTNIEKLELGEKYEDLYQEYLSEFLGEQYKQQWQAEIENNRLRMEYLKQMINILTAPNACWEIEGEHLYFCDENQLTEYNRLYDLVMEEKKPSTGIKF